MLSLSPDAPPRLQSIDAPCDAELADRRPRTPRAALLAPGAKSWPRVPAPFPGPALILTRFGAGSPGPSLSAHGEPAVRRPPPRPGHQRAGRARLAPPSRRSRGQTPPSVPKLGITVVRPAAGREARDAVSRRAPSGPGRRPGDASPSAGRAAAGSRSATTWRPGPSRRAACGSVGRRAPPAAPGPRWTGTRRP